MSRDLLAPAYKRRFILLLFFVCLFNLGDRAVFSCTGGLAFRSAVWRSGAAAWPS